VELRIEATTSKIADLSLRNPGTSAGFCGIVGAERRVDDSGVQRIGGDTTGLKSPASS
jgi:hypothetical protein